MSLHTRHTKARKDDWLVIENKATAGYTEAGDQLAAYVEQVRVELAEPNAQVFGLLIADGASARVQAHLDTLEVWYLSLLSSLGYRRKDWPIVINPTEAEVLAATARKG